MLNGELVFIQLGHLSLQSLSLIVDETARFLHLRVTRHNVER